MSAKCVLSLKTNIENQIPAPFNEINGVGLSVEIPKSRISLSGPACPLTAGVIVTLFLMIPNFQKTLYIP